MAAATRTGRLLLALALIATLSAVTVAPAHQVAAAPALPPDPGQPGPYAVAASDYRLAPVRVPDLPHRVERVGHVVAPVAAAGPRPLVMFLHGRHQSCYRPGTEQATFEWPCADGWQPLPNHLGYDYLQRLLASQGYVTVSVSANAVTGQEVLDSPDQGIAARAGLLRRHLGLWAQWVADPASEWAGRVDLDAVTVVGHSRGGEAAVRLAVGTGASAPYAVDGLVLLAPSDFGRQAAPGVPSVVLTGYCDGDVSNLAGYGYADVGREYGDGEVRSTVLVQGGNHNWFNTEWTPGTATAFAEDDWRHPDDPVCGRQAPGRLSPAQQRRFARAYVAGAVHLVARHDERVLPMFDGTHRVPPSAGAVHVVTTAVGGRRDLIPVEAASTVAATGAVASRICRGQSGGPRGVCGDDYNAEQSPHWPLGNQPPYRPGPALVEVSWTAGRGMGEWVLPRRLDLSGHLHLDARVLVDTRAPAVRLGVRLEDTSGAAVVLTPRERGRLVAMPGQAPGQGSLGKALAQTLRTPLTGVTGVDLTRIRSIGLVPRNERGKVWLLDIAGRSPGLLPDAPAPEVPPDVPVVNVLDVDEPEGSSADPQTVTVPLRVVGALTRRTVVAVRAIDPVEARLLTRDTVVLRPGQRRATMTVPVVRDDVDNAPDVTQFDVLAFATDGTVATGDYAGRVRLTDDDSPPEVTLRRPQATVAEGEQMRWRIGLSEPVEYFAEFSWRVVRGSRGTPQVRTDDVPRQWLRDLEITPPQRPRALWRMAGVRGTVSIAAGDRSTTVAIPTELDQRPEGREAAVLWVRGTVPATPALRRSVQLADAP